MPADFWIANTVSDLIQGDVREHLPLERIPLQGDVLGLGTTTSLDNGELTFLQQQGAATTTIWKCEASSGGIRALSPGDGSGHFPYVCFSGDATALRTPVDLALLGTTSGRPLQELVAEAIERLGREGTLPPAPIYGLRLLARWQELVITVASKLCMGQQRRNAAIASSEAGDGTAGRSLYELLQHYRLAAEDPGDPSDPIRYLGASLQWDCCGFYDADPASGRVTVPVEGAHLHLHGCSLDLRHGGHLHHEHPGSSLAAVKRLALYPLQRLHRMQSDLAIEDLQLVDGTLRFTVVNLGSMDVSGVGVAVVLDDRYGGHRYLRLPWLPAGAGEQFAMPLELDPGQHRIEVIADPEGRILEQLPLQANNRASLEVGVG